MLTAEVDKLHRQGLSGAAIARELGVSTATVCYHLRKLGVPADSRFSRRYDWAEVQRYYDAGNSITACQRRFGFARKTFMDAVARGELRSRPQAMPLDVLLAAPRNRAHVRSRLIAAALKQARCEKCGLSEWLGRPLSLALHHVNGVKDDNRLENLQILCPNCHSQTENFGARNRRPRAAAEPAAQAAATAAGGG